MSESTPLRRSSRRRKPVESYDPNLEEIREQILKQSRDTPKSELRKRGTVNKSIEQENESENSGPEQDTLSSEDSDKKDSPGKRFIDIALCCFVLAVSCVGSIYHVSLRQTPSLPALAGFLIIAIVGLLGAAKFLGFHFLNNALELVSDMSSKLAVPLIGYAYASTRTSTSFETDALICFTSVLIYATLKLLLLQPRYDAIATFWIETLGLLVVPYSEYLSLSREKPYGSIGVVLFFVGSLVMKQTKWQLLLGVNKNSWFILLVSTSVYFLALGL